MTILYFCLILLILFEFALQVVVKRLKKDFQWLITADDECPKISEDSLKKFLDQNYDPVLGWTRKAGLRKVEEVKTIGEIRSNTKKSVYTINEANARTNPEHESLPRLISSYGDSYAFSRHVDDNQTWQWYLSEKTKTNVQNFGVGNYGLDQALQRLRMEYDKNPSKIVIMMVVPETISRVVNIWKHYSEYGNVLGFKGRYVLENGKLRWLQNPIQNAESFRRLEKFSRQIQTNDFCYQKKFRKDQFRFPYSLSLLRNFKRHVPLLTALLKNKIHPGKNESAANRPWELVLERNFDFSIKLFKNPICLDLMHAILLDFKAFADRKGAAPVFVMAPYLHDLYWQQKHTSYYQPLLDSIKDSLLTVDLAPDLLSRADLESLYVSNFYGAHFSPKGNEIAAEIILAALTRKGLFVNTSHPVRKETLC